MRNKYLYIKMLICLMLTCSVVSAQEKLYPDEFPLRDVILIEGPFKHARDLNIKTLLMYDMERLPAPYRKEAGLPSGSTEPVYHIRITE